MIISFLKNWYIYRIVEYQENKFQLEFKHPWEIEWEDIGPLWKTIEEARKEIVRQKEVDKYRRRYPRVVK